MSSWQDSPPGTRNSLIPDVVRTISRAEGVDEVDLAPPLGDVIDTDALERYVESTDETALVTFRYRDWMVEVRGGDQVAVTSTVDDE